MSKLSNQKLKILYLMRIMQEYTDESHGLTLNEIINMLSGYGIKAERKSLYDDFEALRTFGVDIEKRHGKTVTYYIGSRDFEMPELKLLVDAVQSSKFITHKKSSALIKKIENMASRYEAQQLQRQVFVANRIKTMNESIYYTVDDIHRAISADRKISFQYYEWNENKEKQLRRNGKVYVVSPWALTWDDENYYMIAYDSEGKIIKHYRVDKMLKIDVCEERREGADIFKNFDMALYSQKTFGMYGGKDERVILKCRNDMAGIIIDRFGQDVIMHKLDEDFFEAFVKVAVSPLFLTWVMNFGERVKIISPQHVIDQYIEIAKKAIEAYEGEHE